MSVRDAAEAEFLQVMVFLYDIGYEIEDIDQLPVRLDDPLMDALAERYADAQAVASTRKETL